MIKTANRFRTILIFVATITLTTLSGCSDETLSDEDQIRALIDSAENSAEDRDAGALLELVDDSFSSRQRYDKNQIEKLLRLYFFRHKSIYLLTRIRDVEITASDYAFATVFVAMAGTAISDITAIASMRANIYRFDLEFIKDKSWRLASATWQVASVDDLQ